MIAVVGPHPCKPGGSFALVVVGFMKMVLPIGMLLTCVHPNAVNLLFHSF